MKAFFASLGVALALSAPALSVSVWGQCGVSVYHRIYALGIILNMCCRVLDTVVALFATVALFVLNRMTVRFHRPTHSACSKSNLFY